MPEREPKIQLGDEGAQAEMENETETKLALDRQKIDEYFTREYSKKNAQETESAQQMKRRLEYLLKYGESFIQGEADKIIETENGTILQFEEAANKGREIGKKLKVNKNSPEVVEELLETYQDESRDFCFLEELAFFARLTGGMTENLDEAQRFLALSKNETLKNIVGEMITEKKVEKQNYERSCKINEFIKKFLKESEIYLGTSFGEGISITDHLDIFNYILNSSEKIDPEKKSQFYQLIDSVERGEQIDAETIKTLKLLDGITLLEIGGVFTRIFANLFEAKVTTADPTDPEKLRIKNEEKIKYSHHDAAINLNNHRDVLGEEQYDFSCSVRLLDEAILPLDEENKKRGGAFYGSDSATVKDMFKIFALHTKKGGLSIHLGPEANPLGRVYLGNPNKTVIEKDFFAEIGLQLIRDIKDDPTNRIPLSGLTREEIAIYRKTK